VVRLVAHEAGATWRVPTLNRCQRWRSWCMPVVECGRFEGHAAGYSFCTVLGTLVPECTAVYCVLLKLSERRFPSCS
jgi:hypothetical protein